MMTSMPDATIAIEDLVVRRGGREVVRIPALDIPAGSVTGLMGPSGCGKTTLMRSIVGVQRIAAGRVTVLGRPAGSPALRARLGYMTQAPSVYGDLTVRENLAFFGRVLGVGADRVDEVIDAVRVPVRPGQLVRDLSGGERARVSLAAVLLGEPDLLVLDEPTVGLDPLLLLCGLFVPRDAMASGLRAASDVLPLTYAYDSLHRIAADGSLGSRGTADVAVILAATVLALGLGAATLRRRTA